VASRGTPVLLLPRAGVEPGDAAPLAEGFCCLLGIRRDKRTASKYDKESKATSYASTLVDLKEKRERNREWFGDKR
jgi:hypothetical protein